MRRIVSVWLPAWPIERMRRQTAKSNRGTSLGTGAGTHQDTSPSSELQNDPLALVATGGHGLVITAVTAEAAAGGVRPGMALADARALLPALHARPSDPTADRRTLIRLARWCGRYGPGHNIDIGPQAGSAPGDLLLDHGMWIDITGVAHLFGGETALMADLFHKLASFGLTARIALADTLGAAHALARFAAPNEPQQSTRLWVSCPEGNATAALAPLPVEALRLAPSAVATLNRLGLRRIGDLYDLPRAALERRFHDSAGNTGALPRLDQALGRTAEPRRPLVEIPELVVRRTYPAPLISAEGLEAEVGLLIGDLCAVLEARGLGARRIRLVFYRADGSVTDAIAGTSAPLRDAGRIMNLLADRVADLDAGLGIDMLAAEAPTAERLTPTAVPLVARTDGSSRADDAALGELVDRLSNRLGANRVTMLSPRASHIPERSQTQHPLLHGHGRSRWNSAGPLGAIMRTAPRPPILLTCPEPISVTAEVPDGAPALFTWRRISRRIARAEGPERIAPEWWRTLAIPSAAPAPAAPGTLQPSRDQLSSGGTRTRDYYRIEDTFGAGYWVYRNGRYGDTTEDGHLAWFLHGFFA